MATAVSDVERIREALDYARCGEPECPSCARIPGALALLDGVTGLVREGDVVLSGEQARELELIVEALREGASAAVRAQIAERGFALLASGRPDA